MTLEQLRPDLRHQASAQIGPCNAITLPAMLDVPHYQNMPFEGNERVLQREAEHWLRAMGCMVFHMPGILAVKSYGGWPDLIVLAPGGRLLLIELKTAKGKVSPRQQEVFDAIERLGHTVHLARSVGDVRDLYEIVVLGKIIQH